jgi:hypothetical protein
MIWVSALRLFFSRNLLDRAAEKTLLTHLVNRGGITLRSTIPLTGSHTKARCPSAP